jgi:hypothetical protein
MNSNIIFEILLNLDPKKLPRLRIVSKEFQFIISSQHFLKQKILKDFPFCNENFLKSKDKNYPITLEDYLNLNEYLDFYTFRKRKYFERL